MNFFINMSILATRVDWMQYRDPCFKKDADTNKANYRPISIFTALFKVSERIIYKW